MVNDLLLSCCDQSCLETKEAKLLHPLQKLGCQLAICSIKQNGLWLEKNCFNHVRYI